MKNKMHTWPHFTIVTPSYNQAKFLEETIKSVISQNYPNFEYIIIDGGSTDGSVEIIKKYEKYLAYWVSEPDKGQSDAINKGFKCATGDFLTWVNSDDILLPGALNAVAQVLRKKPNLQWITGNTVRIDEKGRIIRCLKQPRYSKLLAKMGLLLIGGPSAFFSRSLYESVEGLRLNLHLQMDSDLWWQFEKKGIHYYRIPEYLIAFRFHADSLSSKSIFRDLNSIETKLKTPLLLPLLPLARMLIKPQYTTRHKIEKKFLLNHYNQKWCLYKLAFMLYRIQQILNGNYLKSLYVLRKTYGRHWSEVFSVDPKTGRQILIM